MSDKITEYWLDRGRQSAWWKGEEFYTIAAVPYYYERRRVLLNLLTAELRRIKSGSTICDFGCGDGYYTHYFRERFPELNWIGVDISDTMLDRAHKRNPGVKLHNEISQVDGLVDHCLSIGVFTCIVDDALIERIFDDISSKCRPGAKLILFDQIAPRMYRKPTLVRRPTAYYVDSLRKRGFRLKTHRLIYYNLHVFFERYLAKPWYRFCARGATDHERRIHSNRNRIYLFMSLLFTKLSFNIVREPDDSKWGYCYLVLEKETPRSSDPFHAAASDSTAPNPP